MVLPMTTLTRKASASFSIKIPRYAVVCCDSDDIVISWDVQADKLPGALNAIHFLGDDGWAVGEFGQVLYTDNGGVSWIDERNKNTAASTFGLEQNYPNPFNPVTAIGYQLSALSQVELSIYNLLGQKVATLVAKKQAAGRYQVDWDASGFASGVYVYRLSARSKAHSGIKGRKLVLMK